MWLMPINLALRNLRQKGHKFKTILSYIETVKTEQYIE